MLRVVEREGVVGPVDGGGGGVRQKAVSILSLWAGGVEGGGRSREREGGGG